jgi:pimeloyl-ACP methyl ester carboxylesterase
MKKILHLAGGVLAVAALANVSALASASNATLVPGLYRDQTGHSIYAAIDIEDDGPVINYLDPQTRRFGTVAAPGKLHLLERVTEKRLTVEAPEGRLGVSLYYADTRKRAAVLLIHGNEDQTRDMGFLIPLFVLNGINVISYDQRGNGESVGSWKKDGPVERVIDVAAIYDAFGTNSLVDKERMGLWAFSNGGWTAPVVALRRPIAFMILVGAPAETIAENIYFEIRQRMQHDGFNERAISDAVQATRALIEATAGTGSWKRAQELYAAAVSQKWFADSGLPPHLQFPMPKARIDAMRRQAIYDPEPALQRVRTPTLALFGMLDRSVDSAHASATLRKHFAKAGMRDFTLRVYENAGHSLVVSQTGYEDQPALPLRYAPGYPEVMLDWLKQRGFLTAR